MSKESDHGCVDGMIWINVMAEDGQRSLAHRQCLVCDARQEAQAYRSVARSLGAVTAPFSWEEHLVDYCESCGDSGIGPTGDTSSICWDCQ